MGIGYDYIQMVTRSLEACNQEMYNKEPTTDPGKLVKGLFNYEPTNRSQMAVIGCQCSTAELWLVAV